MNETLESAEISEPKLLIFTHEETTDHIGYYFNEALQNTIGELVHNWSIVVDCELISPIIFLASAVLKLLDVVVHFSEWGLIS